jgi:hypothetical protein
MTQNSETWLPRALTEVFGEDWQNGMTGATITAVDHVCRGPFPHISKGDGITIETVFSREGKVFYRLRDGAKDMPIGTIFFPILTTHHQEAFVRERWEIVRADGTVINDPLGRIERARSSVIR